MNRRRVALLAVGAAAALLGLALAFVPTLLVGFDLSENVPIVVGLVAVLAGLARARAFLRTDANDCQLPAREVGRPLAVPGEAFDEKLESVPGMRVAGDRRWVRAREELRETAVDVLVRYHGVSTDDAGTMLDEGEWTDDPLAAEFFASPDGTGQSLRESVMTSFGGESPFHRRARRASAEIYELAGGDDA